MSNPFGQGRQRSGPSGVSFYLSTVSTPRFLKRPQDWKSIPVGPGKTEEKRLAIPVW